MQQLIWVLTDSALLSEQVRQALESIGAEVVSLGKAQDIIDRVCSDAPPALLLTNGRCRVDDGENEPPHHKRFFECGNEMMAYAVGHSIVIIPILEDGTFNQKQVRALLQS